jgi:hypothetical protein
MTPQNRASRLRVTEMIVSTLMSSAVAGYIASRFAHSQTADARTFEVLWLVVCGLTLIIGLVRLLRRNKRTPFKEEMAHRRSVVRDEYHPK